MPAITVSIAISLAISAVVTVAKMLLTPKPQQQQPPAVPRPADGKHNLKQSVPSPAFVYGYVKKSGDYLLLEQRGGGAYHLTCTAGHRIHAYVKHYLHDEEVAFMGGGIAGAVVSPSHFVNNGFSFVSLDWRLGLDVESPIAMLLSNFSDIWTADHRGDGLAQAFMYCSSGNTEQIGKVYPQGMPVPTHLIAGALVYDPRDGDQDPNDHNTWAFSTNLALIRLDYLTRPWGGGFALADMILEDWSAAADVCDEGVVNKAGDVEFRYHGGLWGRFDNDPVEIGKMLDVAAELVVYERPTDGKIGVHAGKMVVPDIRLSSREITSIEVDVNRSAATAVLAVRGRWTDPAAAYNTVDAAIYGDPYSGESERTKTVDNTAVQSHNHIQRLQALAFMRANAPRVRIRIAYDAESGSRHVLSRRWVRVHWPSRGLDEAIVEIKGQPELDLSPGNFSIGFEGIVVPEDPYAFDPATQEGGYSSPGAAIVLGGVPPPTGFAVAVGAETLAAGQSAAFAIGSWDHLSDALTYELEYQLDDLSEPPRSVTSMPGETGVRTQHLKDGAVYRFRLRTESNGVRSDWTGYETAMATADPTPPAQPTGFSSIKAGSTVTLNWSNPNSPNLYKIEIFRGATATFGSAVLRTTYYGGVGEARSYIDSGLAAGTYYWWVRSANASPGGEALPVGPQTQTI